jgi:hypothetical protein
MREDGMKQVGVREAGFLPSQREGTDEQRREREGEREIER